MVASLVTLFKKLKFGTDENVGWGPIDLPELELQTTAYWLTAERRSAAAGARTTSTSRCSGAGRAIQAVAAVLLMVDPRDLGLVTQVRSPHSEAPTIYLYEAVPGGIGLSERLFEAPRRARRRGARPSSRPAAATRLPRLHRPSPRSGGQWKALALRLLAAARAGRCRPSRLGRSAGAARDRRRSPSLLRPLPLDRPDGRAARAARRDGSRRSSGDSRTSGPALAAQPAAQAPSTAGQARSIGAERLAVAVGGLLVRRRSGRSSLVESPPTLLPVDRARLATLPGQPPADAPLLCLDTETTGLATAAGTLAFLVGLGWWEGSVFRQVQLLLPDHADEPALLAELAARIPRDGWLVTYNGRGFDWPLLVARYRMARRGPPLHDGHLDLLPLVRRVFRHRMADARLASVEAELLGLRRHGTSRAGRSRRATSTSSASASPARSSTWSAHNDEDVRSLARLLVHWIAGALASIAESTCGRQWTSRGWRKC